MNSHLKTTNKKSKNISANQWIRQCWCVCVYVFRVESVFSHPRARAHSKMTYSAECKLLDPDSTTSATNAHNSRVIYLKKVGSAVFYGVASFLITVVNKTVLTTWQFPSFLALSIGQMVAGIVILVSLHTKPKNKNKTNPRFFSSVLHEKSIRKCWMKSYQLKRIAYNFPVSVTW